MTGSNVYDGKKTVYDDPRLARPPTITILDKIERVRQMLVEDRKSWKSAGHERITLWTSRFSGNSTICDIDDSSDLNGTFADSLQQLCKCWQKCFVANGNYLEGQ